MNDVLAALRELLEPAPVEPAMREVAVDETGVIARPWTAKTLYVATGPVSERPIETGPTARRDFTVNVLLTAWGAGEEAEQRPSAEVTSWLDAKREAYLTAIRGARHGTAWDHIQAGEYRQPSNLELRALALRLTGYVIVS